MSLDVPVPHHPRAGSRLQTQRAFWTRGQPPHSGLATFTTYTLAAPYRFPSSLPPCTCVGFLSNSTSHSRHPWAHSALWGSGETFQKISLEIGVKRTPTLICLSPSPSKSELLRTCTCQGKPQHFITSYQPMCFTGPTNYGTHTCNYDNAAPSHTLGRNS